MLKLKEYSLDRPVSTFRAFLSYVYVGFNTGDSLLMFWSLELKNLYHMSENKFNDHEKKVNYFD
jgi:hypothetical protein